MAKFAVCNRLSPGCSRDQDETYVNVVVEVRSTSGSWQGILDHPTFSDPASNQFAIQLTDEEFNSLKGSHGLYHEGWANLPKWQQQVATNGATKAFGRFAVPTSAASVFATGTSLIDDRFIVRIYDGDPAQGGLQIGTRPGDPPSGENLDETETPGFIVRYLKLFTPGDVPSNTNAANQLADIGGHRMIFDFGSSHSPPLPAGLTTFNVPNAEPGTCFFPSDWRYRVVGPNGEKEVTWRIYGRTLRLS